MDLRFRPLQFNLLVTAGIFCLLMSAVLANGEPTNTQQANTTTVSEANGLPCLPDSALNALLVQMLMAIQPYFLSYQHEQQRRPAASNNNELIAPRSEPIRTTVVTSSIVSTLTQTLSKVISIWYRNERIPTTIYSQTTVVMTELITITSTLSGHVEPTEWKRERREVEDATLLDSSLSEDVGFGYYKTQSLPVAESIGVDALPVHLIQPQVLEAWSNFLHVLQETQNSAQERK